MWRVIVAMGLVLGMTVVVTPPAVLACSCEAMTPAEQLRGAEAAFVGTLVSVGGGSAGNGGEEVDWTFQVEQVIKGELGDTVDVWSPVDSGACGFELAEGMRAGIFLYESDGTWHGSMCGQVVPGALLAMAQPTSEAGAEPTPTPRDSRAMPSATPTEEGTSMVGDFDFGQSSVVDGEPRSLGNRGWLFGVGIVALVVAGGWGVFRLLER